MGYSGFTLLNFFPIASGCLRKEITHLDEYALLFLSSKL